MNVNYDNEEQQTLVGSYKNQYPNLEDHQLQDITPSAKSEQTPQQIVHKVVYGDTLEGISLTYDVSIAKIKQRNKLESDSIYYLKEIIIPDSRVSPTLTQDQQEFMKIEQFVMYMETAEKSTKTAKYYLSENNWDVAEAVAEYRKDLEWERKNKITHIPLVQFNLLQKLKRKDQ